MNLFAYKGVTNMQVRSPRAASAPADENPLISNSYDLFIVGGGINGTGIAADASARGLSVALCEQNDLASATSSAVGGGVLRPKREVA